MVSVLLILMVPAAIFAADFDAVVESYNRNEFQSARREFKKLAQQGHAGAQFYLGEIYEGGVGVPIDYKTAFEWYRKAAQQEHASAGFRLAELYRYGRGTPINQRKAFYWYTRAAEHGYVPAQYDLAVLYESGTGTERNPLKAYMWWSIAASFGDPDALQARASLEASLSEDEIKRAQTLAREWERAYTSENNVR